jgi:cytidyltransferase-like protein
VPFDELPQIRQRFWDKKIIHCHGAFDLVHIGHLRHFEEAKALGDVLIVTITADNYITKKRSVTFTESDRARQVAALEIIDYVAIVQEPSALSAIDALHPDVYVKGPEYADLMLDKSRSIFHEMRVLESYGAGSISRPGTLFRRPSCRIFCSPRLRPRSEIRCSKTNESFSRTSPRLASSSSS